MSTKDGTLSHRTLVFDTFSVPVSDFYSLLEAMLRERAIPGAKITRVFMREGGLLGTKRAYLRVRRGAEVFDISAAAFGERFMVSWWLRHRPRRVILKIFLAFIVLWMLVGRLPDPIASFLFRVMVVFTLLAVFVGVPLYFLVKFIRKIPGSRLLWRGFLGILRWGWRSFRLPTLYESDTSAAFHISVPAVVEEALDALRSARGLRSLGEEDEDPDALPAPG